MLDSIRPIGDDGGMAKVDETTIFDSLSHLDDLRQFAAFVAGQID